MRVEDNRDSVRVKYSRSFIVGKFQSTIPINYSFDSKSLQDTESGPLTVSPLNLVHTLGFQGRDGNTIRGVNYFFHPMTGPP